MQHPVLSCTCTRLYPIQIYPRLGWTQRRLLRGTPTTKSPSFCLPLSSVFWLASVLQASPSLAVTQSREAQYSLFHLDRPQLVHLAGVIQSLPVSHIHSASSYLSYLSYLPFVSSTGNVSRAGWPESLPCGAETFSRTIRSIATNFHHSIERTILVRLTCSWYQTAIRAPKPRC